MTRLKIFIVFSLTFFLASFIYLQTVLHSDQPHQNILNKLQSIDTNSVILNEQILKVRQGLLRNYDHLLLTVDKLETLALGLDAKRLGIQLQPSTNITDLQKKITTLGKSTEYFLSDNSILRNSLTYLPTVIHNFFPRSDEQRILTQQLLEELFLYNQWHEIERKTTVEKLLTNLLISSIVMEPSKDKTLSTIIVHSEAIIKYSDLVNQELNIILSTNITKTIASIRQQYMQEYTQKQRQRQYLNWGIYLIVFGLISVVINLISTLQLSATSLRRSNKQLRSEVQRRTEAETKERAEASFLQTILDNISDGIVVCNNQGILVVFNKAAEAIYGQGLNPIETEQWAQQYQLYDKQGKELLTKEQLPLYKALTKGQVDNEEIVIKFDSKSPKTVLINGKQLIDEHSEKNGALICIRDITERKAANMEMRLAATAFEAHEAIMITDANVNIIRINQKFSEITGYSKDDVLGKNPRLLKSDKHSTAFYQNLWQEVNKNGYWQGEIYNKRKNGETYPEWMSISAIKDELNEVSHYISHFRDLTESKQQQEKITQNTEEEKVLADILQFSFLSLDDFLQQSSEVIVSLPWLKLKPKSGIFLTKASGEGQSLTLACNHNLSTELLTLCATVPFGKCLCGRAAQSGEIQFSSCMDHRHEISFPGIKPHGHYNVPIMDDKKVLGVLVLYLSHGHQKRPHEINFLKRVANVLSLGISRKQAEKKAQYLAYHDGLTSLPNRMLLMDRLDQVIAINKRNKRFAALMYIDFDRFKNINDSLGHSIGDALLQEVALRFKKTIRQEDTVARLGGDEFVVLLSEIPDNKEMATMEAQHIANKLHNAIAKEIRILEHDLFLSLSIGIVIITGAKEERPETLMMQADTAMYQAKKNGRNGTQFFIPEMQAIAQVRLELEKDLRYALFRNEIQVFYQAQNNAMGELVGAEALIRWIHPQRGFISPVDFIPLAEDSGLILELGVFVLNHACQQINHWQNIQSLQHVAVNVSPVQFKQSNFVKTVQDAISRNNIKADQLTLELTEGILVNNVDDVINKMQQLKRLGIHFSIDDFGTGYSSLAYLTRFPLDQLKIDKSFVDDIGKDKNNQVIIETIIAMAERLGFNLIAEGVETIEQIEFLKEKGCFNFQGYYFSKPLPSKEFSEKYL